MAPVLNEQSRRRFAAMEALSLGHGGVSAMSRITGLARSTIGRGISDIERGSSAPAGRLRKPGGGRKRKVVEDPTLLSDLKRLVEPSTRGDPMQPLLWTSLSLRKLASALATQGHRVSAAVVGELLHGLGYSLQANSKVKEGGQHIDRDAQFHYINEQAKAFLAGGEPVISVADGLAAMRRRPVLRRRSSELRCRAPAAPPGPRGRSGGAARLPHEGAPWCRGARPHSFPPQPPT
jgi:transposase